MGVALAKKDPRVDTYIAKAQPFAKPVLNRFRKAVHAGCPDLTETMKWSFPHFDYKGMLCSMAAFKAHCAFGFWKGSLLESAPKAMQGKTKDARGQFGRVTSLDEMPDEQTLVRRSPTRPGTAASRLPSSGWRKGRVATGSTFADAECRMLNAEC